MKPSAARPQPNKNDSQKIAKFAKLDALALASFAPFCSKSLSEKQEIAGKQYEEDVGRKIKRGRKMEGKNTGKKGSRGNGDTKTFLSLARTSARTTQAFLNGGGTPKG